MTVHYPGFSDNPENRPVKSVRTIRFERWPNSTTKNPSPQAEPVPMQFESVPDVGNGMPGVIGRAVIRGAVYAIGISYHDLQWALVEAEREVDLARAKEAIQ